MTDDEKTEWFGDPLATEGANLFNRDTINEKLARIKVGLNSMTVTSLSEGTFRYDGVRLGPAYDFEGKTVTLSIGSIAATAGAYPRIALYWHSSWGNYTATGVYLDAPGSVTLPLPENTQNRLWLVAYVYVSTNYSAPAGSMVRYDDVMLTVGDKKYPFAPYTEVLVTPSTKGAYNHSDMNRVEMAVAELSEMYGLGLTTKTNWNERDIPLDTDLNRYLANLRAIRAVCPDQSNLPELPTDMRKLTYESANNIEKILVAAYEGVTESYRSGEIHSGEV